MSTARNRPGGWRIFLSHSRRSKTALAIVEVIYAAIKGTWLDVKMDDMSTEAMKEGVENSMMVVAVITDDGEPGDEFFSREFCLKELDWARDCNKFILPVCIPEDMHRADELFSKAPARLQPWAQLIRPYLTAINRNHPGYRRVGIDDVLGQLRRVEEGNPPLNTSALMLASGGIGGIGGIGGRANASATGPWSVVISHTANGRKGSLLAAALFDSLESVFLKSKMPAECAADTKTAIATSTMVIAIISDDGQAGGAFFEDSGCMAELARARETDKFIQPVCALDDKQRIGELLAKCADDDLKNLLGNTMFIDLHMEHAGYFKVGVEDIKTQLDKQLDRMLDL
jgi:hypothetical protein